MCPGFFSSPWSYGFWTLAARPDVGDGCGSKTLQEDHISDTSMSGGQALIPPHHQFYTNVDTRTKLHMQVANISNETVHVVVKYFNRTGGLDRTTEVDIAAKEVVDIGFDTASTPNNKLESYYGMVEWTGLYTAQKPIVAHASLRYYVKALSAMCDNSLPINNGLPF